MVIYLTRTYFPEGTNGKLVCEGKFICYTIELPWKNNEKRVSCIPEGKYFIKKRHSQKFQWTENGKRSKQKFNFVSSSYQCFRIEWLLFCTKLS
jgi:hypothetical protein